jgi:general secretion pathway protein D
MRTKLAPTLSLLLLASVADAQRFAVRPNLGRALQAAGPTDAAPAAAAPQATARAQADTSGLAQFESVVEFQPRSPNYKVSFSLEDADLGELVRVIGQLTGKRFIFGGKVRNIKTSVLCPEKVSVAEAYQAFLSILETNGLTVVPQGRFFKIIDSAGVGNQLTPVYRMGENVPTEDRFVTRLHRLSHVGADEVANVLGHFKSKDADITIHGPGNLLIITDTGANIRRMMQIVEEIDVGGAGDQIWIEPVHYGAASDLAQRITDLFDLKGGAQPAPGAPAKPAGGSNSDIHVSKVVADDRTNALIIVATERAYLRILEFLKRVDLPPTGEGEIHVVPLQHADATEIVKTLQDVIQGGGGGGGGGAQPGQKGAQAAVFEGNIKVSADKATNSIVITSSPRDYGNVRAVLDKLDRARRQVFIELVVMDLTLRRTDTVGVKYHGGDTVSMSGGDGIALGGFDIGKTLTLDPNQLQGLALGLRGPDIPGSANRLLPGVSIPAFGVALNALATTSDADILSTPHILATDNIPAEINVGQNIPLQQNIIPAFGGFGGAPGAGAAGAGAMAGLGALGMGGMGMGMGMGGMGGMRQDVGTKIKIVPHLNESNEVRLELTEEISDVAGEAVGNAGQVPLSKRTANTTLVVKDQQTVVIGGLMRNRVSRSESKVPLLGDLPVLGGLFRTSTKTNEKTNLVLVLTPHVIREQSDLRSIFERKMQERQEFLDRYFVFAAESQYDPPRDYSRTNGLVEDMRQHDRELEQKAKLEELLRPKEVKVHSPGSPLEPLGSSAKTSGGAAPAPGAAPVPVAAPQAPAGGGMAPVRMPRIEMGPALRGIRDAQQNPPQP